MTLEENLDRAAVSVRDAARIATSAAPTAPSLSPSSLYRRRAKRRNEAAKAIPEGFKPTVPLTVHWDGIKVAPLVGKGKNVERLPVCVTGQGVEQVLGAGIIPNGTGQAQAEEVLGQATDWNCVELNCALCSDTTSSNTGRNKGACVFIERALGGKKVLYLACRHHALEIIPKSLFEKLIETSSSPDLGALCKRFADEWEEKKIDPGQFQAVTVDPDPSTREILSAGTVQRVLSFASAILKVGNISAPPPLPTLPFSRVMT